MFDLTKTSYFIGLFLITFVVMVCLELFVKGTFVKRNGDFDDDYYGIVFACSVCCLTWPIALPVCSAFGAAIGFFFGMHYCTEKLAATIKKKLAKRTETT